MTAPAEVSTPVEEGATRALALVFRGAERGTALEPVLVGPPHTGEVRLRLVACGACHSDVHKLQGHGLVDPPCVFGHEVSGFVTALGDGVDHLAVGDPVVCSFLVPCGSCAACASGHEDDCGPFRTHLQRSGVRFDGSPRMFLPDGEPLRTSGVGGLATEITMPATAVFPLPDGWPAAIPLTDAAVLGCAALTAYGAVHRAAGLRPDEDVVVLGAGGVGLCTVALAVHAGARTVVGTDVKPEALAAAREFGAHVALTATDPDLGAGVREAMDGREPSVVFDTIGTPRTLTQALDLVGVGGRVVVTGLGGTSGPAAIDDLTVFVRRKITLKGSYAAVPSQDLPALLRAVRDGALDPGRLISARYPFEDSTSAYDDVAAGRVTGRALILMPDPTSGDQP